MKITLRSIAVLFVIVGLSIAVVVANYRAYRAETEFGKGDSCTFYMTSGVMLDLSNRTEQSAKDEIQGAAYRILCQPKYAPIFNAISPQIRLKFSRVRDGNVYQLTCEPLGLKRKSDIALVNEYREELYEFLERHSREVEFRNEE